MYCHNCEKEITSISNLCPFCKAKTGRQPLPNNEIGAWAILCFIVPLAGFILYLKWGDTNLVKAERARNRALAGLLFFVMFSAAGIYTYMTHPWIFSSTYSDILKFVGIKVADEQYANPAAQDSKTQPAATNAKKASNSEMLEYDFSMLQEDFSRFAILLAHNYEAAIQRAEKGIAKSPYGDIRYTDQEFMSSEWVADILGFSRSSRSFSNQNGEYRIVSVLDNIVVIHGLSKANNDNKRVKAEVKIDVKTGLMKVKMFE